MKKLLFLKVMMLIYFICFEAVAQPVKSLPKRRALIIGLSKYEKITDSLPKSRNDAIDFYNLLINSKHTFPMDTIVLLIDNNATYGKIRNSVRLLSNSCNSDDDLIIFFSGHGGVDCGNVDSTGNLVTYDADNLDPTKSIINQYDFTTLKKDISLAIQKHARIIVILDACFSGKLISDSWQPNNISPKEFSSYFYAIVSTSDSKYSYQSSIDDPLPNSYFTFFLINGLKGLADIKGRGMVNIDEIYNFIKDGLDKLNIDQSPKINRSYDENWGKYEFIWVDEKIKSKAEEIMKHFNKRDFAFFKNIPKGYVEKVTVDTNLLIKKFRNAITRNDLFDSDSSAISVFKRINNENFEQKIVQNLKYDLSAALISYSQDIFCKYTIGSPNLPSYNKKEAYLELLKKRLESEDFHKAAKANEYLAALGVFDYDKEFSSKLEAQKYFLKAISFIASDNVRNFDSAKVCLLKAITFNPKGAYIFNALGELYYYYIEDFDEAEKYFTKAIDYAPYWSYPRINLGLLYSENGNDAKAQAIFEEAVKIDTATSYAYANLGLIYYYRSQKENNSDKKGSMLTNAKLFIHNALELSPEHSPYYPVYLRYMAWINLNCNNLREAEENLRKSIKLDSTFSNNIKDSYSIADSLLRLLNNMYSYKTDSSYIYAQNYSSNWLQEFIKSGGTINIDSSIISEFILEDLLKHQKFIIDSNNVNSSIIYDTTSKVIFISTHGYYKSQSNNYELAEILYQLDDFQGCINNLSIESDLEQDNSEIFNLRGRARFAINDYKNAISDFNNAIKLNAADSLAYRFRGKAKYEQKDTIGALDDFNKAAAISKNNLLSSLPLSNYKYQNAFKVYNNIVNAIGNSSQPPQLILSRDNREIASYKIKDNIVVLSEKCYNVCANFGKDSLNALSIVLGHTLVHHYLGHEKAIKNTYNDSTYKSLEAQADYYSILYSYFAGYSPFNIFPNILDSIYKAFDIDLKAIENIYLSDEERKEFSRKAEIELNRIIALVEAGKLLTVFGEFDKAIRCLDSALNIYKFRDVLYYSAIARILKAQSLMQTNNPNFIFPTGVYEPRAILSEMKNNRQINNDKNNENESAKMLNEARVLLLNIIERDKDYIPAYINLSCIEELENNHEFAIAYANRAIKIGLRDNYSTAKAKIVRGISYFKTSKSIKSIKDFQEATIEEKGGVSPYNINIVRDIDIYKYLERSPMMNERRQKKEETIDGRKPDIVFSDNSLLKIEFNNIGNSDKLIVSFKELENSRYISIETANKSYRFLIAETNYTGKSSMDLKIGDDLEVLRAKYWHSSKMAMNSLNRFYIYEKSNIIFVLDNNLKINNWILFNVVTHK